MDMNIMSPKNRALIYAVCAFMSLNIPYDFNGLEVPLGTLKIILFLFFMFKSNNLFGSIKLEKLLKKADIKREFLRDGKIYKIDNARVIKKLEHPYRPLINLARVVFFDAMKKSKLRTVLYQSQKENYFIYTLYVNNLNENIEIIIDPLSTEQAKDWLYHIDTEIFKELFEGFEEA